MAGRTFAIGDIHGCHAALEALLAYVGPTRDDRLVFLGDYVDRGPDSAEVVARLMELRDHCQAVFIKGNHEELMLGARTDSDVLRAWSLAGGNATARSYASSGIRRRVQEQHHEFLDAALDWYETDSHIFVHAPIRSNVPLAQQTPQDWRWSFAFPGDKHESGKQIVCGHCAQRSGVPLKVGGTLCIDTWAHGGEWLTALAVDTGEAIQSNQRAELRVLPPEAFNQR